ncbi:MAG: hypothetical protein AAGI92_06355 [Pseudomonadota bacterium]
MRVFILTSGAAIGIAFWAMAVLSAGATSEVAVDGYGVSAKTTANLQ